MSKRRLLFASALLGAGLVVPAAAHATEHAGVVAATNPPVREYFTQEDIDRSRRYRAPAYALGFIGLGVEIAVLLFVGLRNGRLSSLAGRVGDRWWLQTIVLALAVTVILALAALPFSAGREALDKAWGLSTQSATGFFADIGRGLGFQLVLSLLVALGFYGLVRVLPSWWPLAAGAGAVVLTVVLSMLWPLVYEPLFNKFEPVDAALRQRIVEIGRREGVRVGSVLVSDASKRTTRQNAYVSGLGSTKRVVLYDTLLAKSSPDEVDLVVAHELAHVAHNDVLKGTGLGAAGAAGLVALIWLLLRAAAVKDFLGVSGARDPKSLPFLVMVVVLTGIAVLPIGNWYSRRVEASADRMAVRVTGDWQTAIDVEVNLARDNLADLSPNPAIRFWFYTHPPVMERIGIALEERDRLAE